MNLARTQEEFDEWLRRVHDEQGTGANPGLGSLNFLDGAARARGCASISAGICVGLAQHLQAGPNVRGDDGLTFDLEVFSRPSPEGSHAGHGFGLQSDHVELDCHGPVNTHIDALNHIGLFGTWFDGTPISQITTAGSVAELADVGIFTRAVYADIPAARGTEFVEPNREVTGSDIDDALARTGVTFEPGDALLLDGGREKYEQRYGPWHLTKPRAGHGPSVAAWIVEHRPSIVLWDMCDGDNTLGVYVPVHKLNWAIGLVMVDNCDFTQARQFLAKSAGVCALVVAPLPIDGATGNNVNPMLIF